MSVEETKKKRKDTCLFCNSRSCYERIMSTDDGKTYDEIACHDHINDLYKHSDKAAPNVMKFFITSTGKHKRGERFDPNP